MPEIDFKRISETALGHAESVVSYLLPDGKREGVEWVALNPTRPDQTKGSFKVNLNTGIWSDFATGDKGGDLIDLWAYVNRCSNGDAAVELRDFLNLPDNTRKTPSRKPQDDKSWLPIIPIPVNAPAPPGAHLRHGKPSAGWCYKDAHGRLMGYVYRFEIAGKGKELLPLTYCSNKSGEKGWRWKSFEKPRPLYGLDRLAKNPGMQVMIVEGEKCADAGQSVLSNAVVISWIGGAKAIDTIDFTPLAGRKIILWPDNDSPGIQAMISVWKKIKSTAAGVMAVNIPVDKASGWDIADAIDEGMSERQLKDFIKLNLIKPEALNAKEVKPKKPDKPQKTGPPDPEKPKAPKTGGIFDKAPFRCLGYNHGLFFYFPYKSGQVVELSPDRHNKNNLITLAPLQWWEESFMSDRGVAWTAATNALMQLSYAIGVFDSAKIRGCGAWFDDGKIVLHLGNRLVVDNTPMKIQEFNTRYIYEIAPPTEIEYSAPLSRKEAYSLVEIFQMCPVATGLDAKYLAGWCVIAPVCGALSWRPHIWITGSKGTGKTWILNNIISPLLGTASLEVLSKSTEAGVRQQLGHNAFPVLFDEAESKDKNSRDRIDMILELMRGSSSESGAVIVKGSSTGRSMSYRIRSCFCLGSITIPIQYSADESRITVISLQPKSPAARRYHFELLEQEVAENITPEWCASFRARSISLIPVIRKNALVFGKAIAEKLSNQRLGDQLGTLLAGAYTLYSDNEISIEKARAWVEEQDWAEQIEAEKESDEKRCLSTILQQLIPVIEDGRRIDKSIIELVHEAKSEIDPSIFLDKKIEEAQKSLLRIGIRVRHDDIVISNSHEGIKRIMGDGPFAKNWGRLLERLPGTVRLASARFIDGIITRAVAIPMNLVIQKEEE